MRTSVSMVTFVAPRSILAKLLRVIPILAASFSCETPATSRAALMRRPTSRAARFVRGSSFAGTLPEGPLRSAATRVHI